MTAGEPKTSFRPRSTYLGRLEVGSGEGAVLIEPAVAGELRMAAALAGPRSAAGLLYGYCHHDQEGGYTLVNGFVPAEAAGLAQAGPDPWAARDRLRAEAARSYPGMAEVGWWRTAPRPGEGEGWPDPGAWPLGERPEGVGLVVFADGTPPAASGPPPHPVVAGTVVPGTVLEERLAPPQPQPARIQPAPPAPGPSAPGPNGRPTRGRVGPAVQSPLLVDQNELRSRRRLEPERGGRFDLEAQQWVLLAMVVLALVVVITICVLVIRTVH